MVPEACHAAILGAFIRLYGWGYPLRLPQKHMGLCSLDAGVDMAESRINIIS